MRFESQLKVLRGWAIAGRENPTPSNDDVADVCGISGTTISGNNAFLVEAGLLVKEGGGYRPSSATLEYGRAVEWRASEPEQKLAPALTQSWFWQALAPRLRFESMSRDDAMRRLAEQANAGTEHRNQLSTILDWLEAAGLLREDGEQISLVQFDSREEAVERVPSEDGAPVGTAPRTEQRPLAPDTRATGAVLGAGAISLTVNVEVGMSELLGWEPARIAAFFEGVAKVVSAQRGTTDESRSTD